MRSTAVVPCVGFGLITAFGTWVLRTEGALRLEPQQVQAPAGTRPELARESILNIPLARRELGHGIWAHGSISLCPPMTTASLFGDLPPGTTVRVVVVHCSFVDAEGHVRACMSTTQAVHQGTERLLRNSIFLSDPTRAAAAEDSALRAEVSLEARNEGGWLNVHRGEDIDAQVRFVDPPSSDDR